jgi:hypothetical protein
LNGEEPVGVDEVAPPAGKVAAPAARTPVSIVLALVLFAVAIGTPLFGIAQASRETGGFQVLGTVLLSLMGGGVAAVAGIICTIIGAWGGPRTAATTVAIVLAALLTLPLLFFLALASGAH